MYLYATYKRKDLCVMRRTTYKTFYIAVGTVHKTAHCTGHCFLKKKGSFLRFV